MKKIYLILSVVFLSNMLHAQQQEKTVYPQMNGVYPHLSIVGNHKDRSETGIGALVCWANKLWMVGYVAHIRGSGAGLYEIDANMNRIRRPESVTGTYANRMIHDPSNQAIIGPHIIDTLGVVRTFSDLSKHRLTATFRHLFKPDSMVYFLTMEGLLFEANVHSLQTKLVADVVKDLYKKTVSDLYKEGIYTHFKSGYCQNGKVIVANNAYQEGDYVGTTKGGILAEWDGKKWTVIDNTAYIEINGKNQAIYGHGIWAIGWDKASVKMKFWSPKSGTWQTYRMPKGSQAWEHAWNTEWMRIREVQTERFMMDAFGILYELPVMVYGGKMMNIKPVCNHLRVIPDMISWRGMLVLAGDQIDNSVGQPQSNLLFTTIDELWKWGKPSGQGAVWKNEDVKAGTVSDPYLFYGFDKKTMHIHHQSKSPEKFTIEVDITGDGNWAVYKTVTTEENGYYWHSFPDGFSASWVRVTSIENVQGLTVQFYYN